MYDDDNEDDFLYARFKKYRDEFLMFDRVEEKYSKRADLHAFILLDRLFPGDDDIISYADHDEIYLYPERQQIEKLTDEQILELVRCGVQYEPRDECLHMFT